MDINDVSFTFNKVMGKRAGCTAIVENGNCIVRRSDGKTMMVLGYDGTFLTFPANKRRWSAKRLMLELKDFYRPMPRRQYRQQKSHSNV